MTVVVVWFFLLVAPGDWSITLSPAFLTVEHCAFAQRRAVVTHQDQHVSNCLRYEYGYEKDSTRVPRQFEGIP